MPSDPSVDPALLRILACPACRSPLTDTGDELVCTSTACGLAYPVAEGIPVLLVDEARAPGTGPGPGRS